jgi:small-conductance mechanosensitive channel
MFNTEFEFRIHLWLLNEGLNLLKLIVLAFVLIRLLRWATDHAAKWARDPNDAQRAQQIKTMAGVVDGFGRVVILGFAAATGLREIGLDVRPVIAGASIIGIAVGLGAQNVVRDAINGVLILLDNQYGVGDTIRTNGVTGTVEEMSLRRTVLRDADGAQHTIPNGDIRIVANLTRFWAQVTFSVPVTPNQPVDRVLEVLSETGRELAAIPEYAAALLEPPKILGVEKLSGQQLEIMLQVKTKAGRQFDVSRAWKRLIKQAFEKENIPFHEQIFFREPNNSSSLPPTA